MRITLRRGDEAMLTSLRRGDEAMLTALQRGDEAMLTWDEGRVSTSGHESTSDVRIDEGRSHASYRAAWPTPPSSPTLTPSGLVDER